MTDPELLYDEIFALLYQASETYRQFLVGAHGRSDLSVSDHQLFVSLWREITQDLFDHRRTSTRCIRDDSPLRPTGGFEFVVSGHHTDLYQAFYVQHALWFAEAVMTQHVGARVTFATASIPSAEEQVVYVKTDFIASKTDLVDFLLPVKHAISAIFYMHTDIMESPMRCKQFLQTCMPLECNFSAAYYMVLRVIAAFGSACGALLPEAEGDSRSKRKAAWLNFSFCRQQITEHQLKAVCAVYRELLAGIEATVNMQEFVLRGEEAEEDADFPLALACYRTACRSHGWEPHARAIAVEKHLFPELKPTSGDRETPIEIDGHRLMDSPPRVDAKEMKGLHKLGVRPELVKRRLQLRSA